MIHYHGTPITPRSILHELAGHHFCVRFGEHRDVEICHQIGQSVVLDNGAFPKFRSNQPTDWPGFYKFARFWMDHWTTWVVIPDVIDGTEEENDLLVAESIRQFQGMRQIAPVWHLHERFERLEKLVCWFDRVCIGSSGDFWQIGTPAWNNRMNEAFNRICRGSGRPPAWIHMLRGMSLSGSVYPFASVDSTDVARNHEGVPGRALKMAQRWDAIQCPGRWQERPVQIEIQHSFT